MTLVSPERSESKEDARCREDSAARKDPFVVIVGACGDDGTRVVSDGRRGWAVTVFEDEEEEDRDVGETGDSISELTTSSASCFHPRGTCQYNQLRGVAVLGG